MDLGPLPGVTATAAPPPSHEKKCGGLVNNPLSLFFYVCFLSLVHGPIRSLNNAPPKLQFIFCLQYFVSVVWTPHGDSSALLPSVGLRIFSAQGQEPTQPTCSTAFFTFSIVLAVTKACSGSSSPGNICPSFRPTFPSFTDPFPRIMILALHSFSMFFSVLPLKMKGLRDYTRRPMLDNLVHREKCFHL